MRSQWPLALCLLVLMCAPLAAAESATVRAAKLPVARQGSTAVWDGTYAYIIGGTGVAPLNILRYDPRADIVEVMVGALPAELNAPSSFYDGRHAYVLGGSGRNEIYRYEPQTNSVVELDARLPNGLELAGLSWDGTNAYLFGGHVSGGMSAEIIRFVPANVEVKKMGARLPEARTSLAAFFDGKTSFVVGGYTERSEQRVARYDAASDSVVEVAALPAPVRKAVTVWSGNDAFTFGGTGSQDGPYEIVGYRPASDVAWLSSTRLPISCVLASAVWTGSEAILFGCYIDGKAVGIVAYDPTGGGPPAAIPTTTSAGAPVTTPITGTAEAGTVPPTATAPQGTPLGSYTLVLAFGVSLLILNRRQR